MSRARSGNGIFFLVCGGVRNLFAKATHLSKRRGNVTPEVAVVPLPVLCLPSANLAYIVSERAGSYQYTRSRHSVESHIRSQQIVPDYATSYWTTSHHVVPHQFIRSYQIRSYHMISYQIIRYHVRSHNLILYYTRSDHQAT